MWFIIIIYHLQTSLYQQLFQKYRPKTYECIDSAESSDYVIVLSFSESNISIPQIFSDTKLLETDITKNAEMKSKLEEYQQEIENLKFILMKLEVDLLLQLNKANEEFENKIKDMMDAYMTKVQKWVDNIRDLEQQFSEEFKEFCKVPKHLLNIEDMENFLTGDQSVQTIATKCHEQRVMIIERQERRITKRLRDWQNDLITNIYADEVRRNRKRVYEILNFTEHNKKEETALFLIESEEESVLEFFEKPFEGTDEEDKEL